MARRARRRRRARRLAVLVLGLALLAVIGLTARDAMAARDRLLEARSAVSDARSSMASRDLGTAMTDLARAGSSLDRAADRVGQPGWRALQRVPLLGRSLRQVTATVVVGRAAVDVGTQAIERIEPLLGRGGAEASGGLDTARLAATATELSEIQTSDLVVALANLDSRPSGWVLDEVGEATQDVSSGAHELLRFLEQAKDMMATFATFLGDQEPRKYFLAMQNPAELRGTGGFLGFFAILTVDQGRFELAEPTVYGDLTPDEAADEEPTKPHLELAGAEFEARYAHAAASSFLANANVDPDVPTTAEVILDIYERSTGDRLDGVIMVDPFVLAGILDVVGPVTVADEFQPERPGLPRQLRGADVVQAIVVDEYDVFGGNNPARKRWLREVATQSFSALFDRDWAVADLAERLSGLAGRGHLQIYSRSKDEQTTLETTRLAGTLRHRSGEDLLAVTANNAAANKADVHVAHRFDVAVQIHLESTGSFLRSTDLRAEVVNPLPTSGRDDYIIGSSPIGRAQTTGPTGEYGLVRTWFSVWLPPDGEVLQVLGPSQQAVGVRTFDIHGTRVFDHVLETASMSTSSFEARWDGLAHVGQTEDGFEYRLRWRRQTKAIPDRLAMRVSVPAGFEVLDASFDTAPSSRLLGLDGDPGPALEVGRPSASVVTLEGDATSDVVLVVRFART